MTELYQLQTSSPITSKGPLNILNYKYRLLTKCEVKMTEGWPSSFLCVYGPRWSRDPSTRKKITRSISSHPDQTRLVNKGFIIWLLGKFFSWDTTGSREQARYLHLAHFGNQSQCAICVILLAHGASHIIISVTGFWPLLTAPWKSGRI